MHQSDAYYRGFLAYMQMVSGCSDCLKSRRMLAEGDGDGAISVKRVTCTVDEDWIQAIEAGLVHIEKAIREDRQFIHSNGEVVPIERVKHVSKDSVEHLARHAELISRAPEGEDIIPDKLYTVERLSDYAVYENRFLYMLLCYLRDFVSLRYRRIRELTLRYEGELTFERRPAGEEGLTLSLRLQDVRGEDPYLAAHNPMGGILDRMDLILKTVAAFLATPLMESAAKVAMLRPPITKTNVLKMDNNFKGAMALYEYVIAYEGDGYTVEEETEVLSPLRGRMGEGFAEAGLLLSHLTRQYALDMEAELEASRQQDEGLARLADLKSRAERLAVLRRRGEAGEISAEYVAELEALVGALQKEADRSEELWVTLHREREDGIRLQGNVKALEERIAGFDEERRGDALRHETELQEMAAAYAAAQTEERGQSVARMEALRASHGEELAALRMALAEQQTETARLTARCRELESEKRLMQARALGQSALNKEITVADMEAMTDKESCDELERQLEAFVDLYGKVWKRTKRKIRKELLDPKYIRGRKGGK